MSRESLDAILQTGKVDDVDFVLTPDQVLLRELAVRLGDRYVSVEVTPTLSTAAYASGDVLFVPVEVPNVALNNGESVLLESVKIIDREDNPEPIDIVILRSEVAIGALNAAAVVPASAEVLSIVKLVAGDYTDLGSLRIGLKTGLADVLTAGSATTSFWIAGIIRAAETYSNDDSIDVVLSFRRS